MISSIDITNAAINQLKSVIANYEDNFDYDKSDIDSDEYYTLALGELEFISNAVHSITPSLEDIDKCLMILSNMLKLYRDNIAENVFYKKAVNAAKSLNEIVESNLRRAASV